MKRSGFKSLKASSFLLREINFARENSMNFSSFYLDTDFTWRYVMKKKMEIRIGSTLNWLMNEQGISIKELSFLSGVPQSTISHMKNNRQPRDISTVMAVAQALNVSLYYLLYGQQDPTAKADVMTDLASELFSGVFEVTVKKIRKKS